MHPRNPKKYVLGLDLGTSSVGWAVIEVDDTNEPIDLVALGTRHFEEVMEDKGKKLKNEKRRQMRGLRRNTARRKLRKESVLRILRSANLAPAESEPYAESLSTLEPYRLRAKAAEEQVTLLELGRALYHMAQRRGFKSNRGAKLAALRDDPEVAALLANDLEEDTDSDSITSREEREETGKILSALKQLDHELGNQTLGQFFYAELLAGRKVRRRFTRRGHYEHEFNTLWETQKQFYPAVLTDPLKAKLSHALFYQRPLKAQPSLVGKCALEPTKKRAAQGTLIAQRFRIWQDLANLALLDHETGEKRNLTLEEKKELGQLLETKDKLTWAEVAKILGGKLHSEKKAGLTFNLQTAYKDGLTGNKTACRIAKLAPELWETSDEDQRTEIVEMILTSRDRGTLFKTLRAKYKVEPTVALSLATLELPAGYAALSSKAMTRMLEHLRQGATRIEAQTQCGYTLWENEIETVEQLPPPTPQFRAEITSPRVRKAINQTRKVVNALVREYGKPYLIRIEMAREMSLNDKEKTNWIKVQKDGEKENEQARDELKKMGIPEPTRADVTWYRLGKQVGWICPYSGKTIPQTAAATGEFQIEHIVPYEIAFDSSFNNLTLCHKEWNERKGKRTPFQAFGGDAKAWKEMSERIDKITGPGSGHKKKLFKDQTDYEQLSEEVRNRMIERQLNESRWIARSAATYLRPIVQPKAAKGTEVECTRGAATHMIRTYWRLMEPLYQVNEKRRDDLRHHAVDAVAIAMTSRSLFMKATKARKAAGTKVTPLSKDLVPEAPSWLNQRLRELLPQVVVSHETTRQIQGAFHEETVYGQRSPKVFHVRKPLANLNENEIERIVDERLQALVLAQCARYRQVNGKLDIAKALERGVPYGQTVATRARIIARIKEAKMVESPAHAPTRYMQQGNNHHVAIFENLTTGKREGRFVTMVEAAAAVRKHKRKLPVNPTPPPGWKFIAWLCGNDTLLVETAEGEGLYRVQVLDPVGNRLWLREAQASTVRNDAERLLKGINVLRFKKLEVDPIGRFIVVPEGKL
jgi:CRISPR-associated endonuclease Csn1